MILAIVGDVTSEEAFAARRARVRQLAARRRAGRARSSSRRRRRGASSSSTSRTRCRPRSASGSWRFRASIPDYLAWDLAVKILGGEGANRLHRVLRSERGLTYGASADTEARKQAGDYRRRDRHAHRDDRRGAAADDRRVLEAAARACLRARAVRRAGLPGRQLSADDRDARTRSPRRCSTSCSTSCRSRRSAPSASGCSAVTPDDIQRVARQYVRPDRLSIVLVGNAAAFVPQLRQVGFSDFEVIPIDQLDLMSATFRKQGRPRAAAAKAAPAADVVRSSSRSAPAYVPPGCIQADAVQTRTRAPAISLKRVIEAQGGLDALRKVRTVVADADTTFQMEQGHARRRPPRPTSRIRIKFRVDATVRRRTGRAGLQRGQRLGQGSGGRPRRAAADARRLRGQRAPRHDPDADCGRRRQADAATAARRRAETAARSRCSKSAARSCAPVELFIDAQNLIARQAFATPGPDGRPVQAEEVFSDYRTRRAASRCRSRPRCCRNGRVILSRALTNVTLNTRCSTTRSSRAPSSPHAKCMISCGEAVR